MYQELVNTWRATRVILGAVKKPGIDERVRLAIVHPGPGSRLLVTEHLPSIRIAETRVDQQYGQAAARLREVLSS